MLYHIWLDFGVRIHLKNFAKMCLAGTIMYGASFFLSHGELILLLWSAILFAFYLILLYIFGEIKKEDFIFLKDMISKKKVEKVEEELSGNEPSA
jgi:hypothetical protein